MQIKKLSDVAVEMIAVATDVLKRRGVANGDELGGQVVLEVCSSFGGAPVYLGAKPDSTRARTGGSGPRSLNMVAKEIASVAEGCLRGKVKPGAEADLAVDVVAALAVLFGGRPFYVPRNELMKKALRDIQIGAECSKLSIRELAKKHGLCVQQVYKIIKAQPVVRRDERLSRT
jgi:Mor family transcriptional regulator